MADLTIRVPSEQADALRRCLLRAYAATTAGRQRAAAAVRDGDQGAIEAMLGHHREMSDIGRALDQLGWEPGGDDGQREVTAHPEVLSDAAHEALARAVTAFAEACEAYWRGADRGAEAADRLRAVSALFDLFTSVQEGG